MRWLAVSAPRWAYPIFLFHAGVHSGVRPALPLARSLLLCADKDRNGGGERDFDCADASREESSESPSTWLHLLMCTLLALRGLPSLTELERLATATGRQTAFPPVSIVGGAPSEVDVPVMGVEYIQLSVSPVGAGASMRLTADNLLLVSLSFGELLRLGCCCCFFLSPASCGSPAVST